MCIGFLGEKGGKYVSRARVVYCLDGFGGISLLDVTVVLVVFLFKVANFQECIYEKRN